MKNNKGFISTSIIFAFFITFLMLLVIIITTYAQNRILMNQVKKDMKNNLVIKYNFNSNEISNIVKAYTYNQDSTASNYCVTGEEETCVKTTCYELTEANSCAAGTIIDYKVNDTDTVRFHVMYDNGETMTMQSQKNTVYNVEWINANDYAEENIDQTKCSYISCSDEGPITILNALENKTGDWSNVNTINYTMGTTIFKTNAYTECSSFYSCTANRYTLDERSANSRIITLQEAKDLGCTTAEKSCPIWMYNYLNNSTNYGGTINDTTTENGTNSNDGYWTMNANPAYTFYVWRVYYNGSMNSNSAFSTYIGARAVVEINKE